MDWEGDEGSEGGDEGERWMGKPLALVPYVGCAAREEAGAVGSFHSPSATDQGPTLRTVAPSITETAAAAATATAVLPTGMSAAVVVVRDADAANVVTAAHAVTSENASALAADGGLSGARGSLPRAAAQAMLTWLVEHWDAP